MPTPDRLTDLSGTAASNSPAGSDTIGTTLDDVLRGIQAAIRGDLAHKGSDIASTATPDVGAVRGLMHDITGTTTITGLGTVSAGIWKILKFEGALTLTHNATSLILPGGANITTADGDVGIFISEGSGNWRCLSYVKASAAPVTMSPITNTISGDVALNNTANYFTGPTIAQGSAGTWFASGSVSVLDSAGAAVIAAKLWDGTTVIASAIGYCPGANQAIVIALSGYLASPAGNIRISVRDVSSTSGKIVFNDSGNSKDGTLSAFRIA